MRPSSEIDPRIAQAAARPACIGEHGDAIASGWPQPTALVIGGRLWCPEGAHPLALLLSSASAIQ